MDGQENKIELSYIAEPLLSWFHEQARVLPWREDRSPYRIWVSEIMLQQTRVEAVKPYFERFMKAFPNVEKLAAADMDRLLKLWEGLGYYNRVRNMKKAAVSIMENYGGKFPEDSKELKKLPGIGDYTAGAISSIAYGIPVPAVDGNVLRVITRITADSGDIMKLSVKRRIESEIKEIIPAGEAGEFNQALMELGAIICLPNGAPKCRVCPVKKFCMAYKQDRIEEFPVKARKKLRKTEDRTILMIRNGDKIVLSQRENSGLLAGLWEYPNLTGWLDLEEVLLWLDEQGIHSLKIEESVKAKHIFSHIEWNMQGYSVLTDTRKLPEGFVWEWKYEKKRKRAIPSAFEAYTRLIEKEAE